MERALVVTDPSDAVEDLVREAGELAAAAGTSLVVLTVVTEDEFDADAGVLEKIGSVEGTTYNLSPQQYAEEVAETAVNDLLSDVDVETSVVGVAVDGAGDRAEAIVEVAEKRGCDYIFLVGRRRSPTGKAIFGDTAQSVILNFDGHVVVTLDQ